jgi:hypothetical protein
VKVFWQDRDGIDPERVIAHRIAKCLAQEHDVFGDAQERTPVVCDTLFLRKGRWFLFVNAKGAHF